MSWLNKPIKKWKKIIIVTVEVFIIIFTVGGFFYVFNSTEEPPVNCNCTCNCSK